MVDSGDGVAVALTRGTGGWDQVEDTSNPFQLPYLGPVLYPCPFVPGGENHGHGSPDVTVGEAVVGTLVGERSPACCVHAFRQPVVSFAGVSGRLGCFQ